MAPLPPSTNLSRLDDVPAQALRHFQSAQGAFAGTELVGLKAEALEHGDVKIREHVAGFVRTNELSLQNATGQKPFFIGADRYNIASQVAFYMREPHDCVNDLAFGRRSLGFKYWTDLKRFVGRPAVVAVENPNQRTMLMLSNHFLRVGLPKQITVETVSNRKREYWLIDCHGYRIIPQNSGEK